MTSKNNVKNYSIAITGNTGYKNKTRTALNKIKQHKRVTRRKRIQ